MKIRNGFVSNSSSSSFIIGIAKVADEKALKKILKKVPKEDKADYVFGTYDEVLNSHLVSRVYRHITKYDSDTQKFKTEDAIEKIMIEAPVNSFQSVAVENDGPISYINKNEILIAKQDKKGRIYWHRKNPVKWFAICSGNDEGDGGDSPFYRYNKWQKFLTFCIQPINWMSRNILYPIIKVLNKIFKKEWFYPSIYITPKSGYDKVKDHTFFKKEWQREIVKAFEDADDTYGTLYQNNGIFSDEYGCHSYKIGADRNG